MTHPDTLEQHIPAELLETLRTAGAAPELPLKPPHLSGKDWEWLLVTVLRSDAAREQILLRAVAFIETSLGTEHAAAVRTDVRELSSLTVLSEIREVDQRLGARLRTAVPDLTQGPTFSAHGSGSLNSGLLMDLAAQAGGTLTLLLACIETGIDVPAGADNAWLTLVLSGIDATDAAIFLSNAAPARFTPALHRLAVHARANGTLRDMRQEIINAYVSHCGRLHTAQSEIAASLVASGVAPADADGAARALQN